MHWCVCTPARWNCCHVKPQFGQLVGQVKGPHVAAATGAAAEQQRSESSKEYGEPSMTGSSGDDDDIQMTVRPPATHAIAHDSSSRYDHVSTKRQLTMQDSIGGEDLHVPSCQKGGRKTPAAEKKKPKLSKKLRKLHRQRCQLRVNHHREHEKLHLGEHLHRRKMEKYSETKTKNKTMNHWLYTFLSCGCLKKHRLHYC